MQTISRLEEKDFKKYEKILTMFGIASGSEIDDGYKINVDGKDFLLFPFGPINMVYYEENGVVKSSIVQTDENNRVTSFTLNGRQIVVNDNGISIIDEQHNQQSLYYLINEGINLDDVSNNGVVIYSQYRSSDDMSLELRYEHNSFNNRREIYTYHTKEPFYVSFRQHASKYKFLGLGKNYYKIDFDARDNKFLYDLATLREYGVGAVWSHGTVALHSSWEFSKYYREIIKLGEYTSLLSFPFSKGLDEEDIEDMIKRVGFEKNVPQSLINLYNNAENLVRNRQVLLDIYYQYVSGEVLKKGM